MARLGVSLKTKRKPSLIPLERFSSSSAVPLGLGGRDQIAMISATNDKAFVKNAEAVPNHLTRYPPTVGPSTREPWKTERSIEMPFWISARPTSSGTKAVCVGISKELEIPSTTAKARISQISI